MNKITPFLDKSGMSGKSSIEKTSYFFTIKPDMSEASEASEASDKTLHERKTCVKKDTINQINIIIYIRKYFFSLRVVLSVLSDLSRFNIFFQKKIMYIFREEVEND